MLPLSPTIWGRVHEEPIDNDYEAIGISFNVGLLVRQRYRHYKNIFL